MSSLDEEEGVRRTPCVIEIETVVRLPNTKSVLAMASSPALFGSDHQGMRLCSSEVVQTVAIIFFGKLTIILFSSLHYIKEC